MKCIFAVGLLFLLTRGPSVGVSAQLVEITNCNVIGGNTEVTLIATLDESQSGTCTLNPLNRAFFRITGLTGTPSQRDLCTQDLTASCSSTELAGGCSCVSKTGSVWTFHQKFTFNPATQTGATIDLVPSCVPDTAYLSRTKCTSLQPVYVQDVGGFFLNPKPVVTEGERVTMTFLLDDRQYPSKCITPVSSNTPQFLRSATIGGTGSPVCTVPDITTCPTTGYTSGTLGCGCVNHRNNYWTIEYNFIADVTATGFWTANIACLDADFSSALKFVTLVSDRLTVQPSATTTSPTTTSVHKCSSGAAVGVTVADLIFIDIVVVVAIIICL